jgi:predicted DNA-binding transcriptional regulator YafY
MARGDQLARQWRIIQLLVASKHGKTVAELGREENCTIRTIYRDMEALQEAGFPIFQEREDGKSIWAMIDEWKHHLPVPFTLTELMALYFSRDLISVFKGTVFYDSLESLFAKIKTTLPPESLAYLDDVEQTLYIGFKPHKDFKRFKEIIKQINDAAVKHRTIDMIYKTMSRGGEENRRKVDPYKVMFFDSTFYLIGHCHLRKEVRMFVLDRIKMMNITDETFEVPSDFDLETYMQSPFKVIHDKPVKVKVLFQKEVAAYIKEKIWHHTQRIDPRPDGSIVFTAEVAGIDEIRHWIMSWGNNAEALEPKLLREEIAKELSASLKRYVPDARRAKEI